MEVIGYGAEMDADFIKNDLDVLFEHMNSELKQHFPECHRNFLRRLNTAHYKMKELKKDNPDFCVDELINKYKSCVTTWKILQKKDTFSHLRRD